MNCFITTNKTNQNSSQSSISTVIKQLCIAPIIVVTAVNGLGADISFSGHRSTTRSNQNSYSMNNECYTPNTYDCNVQLNWDGDSVMSFEKEPNLQRLDEIEKFEDNWNENGANKFSASLLARARQIVKETSFQGQIFPTARDSIQFEYENTAGDYLEMEVFDTGRIKLFSFNHDGETVTKDINQRDISDVVRKFYGQYI